MFGVSSLKMAIVGIAALAVLTIIGLGYRHYVGLVDTVATLRSNNTKLEAAVHLQQDTISVQKDVLHEWSLSQEKLLSRIEQLQAATERAGADTRRLEDLFSRHDLSALVQRKPGLIERRLNAGTRAANGLLECASGADRADCAGGGAAPATAPAVAKP